VSAFSRPPPRLVDAGLPTYGRFTAAPRDVNLLDARLGRLPRALRSVRLKRWQAVQIVSEQLFLHVALFDARWLSMLQVRLFDRVRARQVAHERILRPGAFRVPTALDDSVAAYRDRRSKLTFENHVADGRIDVTFDVPARRDVAALAGTLTIDTRPATHHVACMPLSNGGAMYAHKGMFPVSGTLRFGAHAISLDASEALALLDQQLGTYPYVMEWDWATAAARGTAGEPLGFNLTRNQGSDPERYNECCVFQGERVAALPPVQFTRERRGGAEQWRIRDREGRVALSFVPQVAHGVPVDAWLVESRYDGPLGTFTGYLAPEGHPRIEVNDWFGMAERFWLRC